MKIINVDDPKPKEVRYYMASVRAPRNDPQQWSLAGLEFMRKKAIGKQVKIRLEYKKNISIFRKEDPHANTPPPSDEATGDMYFVSVHDTKTGLFILILNLNE